MIYTQPGMVSPEICRQLIDYFETHPEQLRPGDTIAQDLFEGRDMDPREVVTGHLKRELEILRLNATVKMSKLYDTMIYMDYWDIVKWDVGQSMVYHADNVDENRKPFDYCGWRTHSAILYLNDNYKGGETMFRDQNVKIYPETGKLLMFPAGYDYTHGVCEVTEGKRYTIALWFTENRNFCLC